MALNWTDVEYKFTSGINGKESSKITTGPLVLENANFDEVGTINKRPTYTATASTVARNIISRDSFPLFYRIYQNSRIPALSMYAPSANSGFDDWRNAKVEVDKSIVGFYGSLSMATYPDIRLLDCIAGNSNNEVIYANQYYYAATTFLTTYGFTKDLSTGQITTTHTLGDNQVNGRFIKVGTYGHIWIFRKWFAAALDDIAYYRKPAGVTTFSSGPDVTTGVVAAPWDACYYYNNTSIATVWLDGANKVNITTWNVSTGNQIATVNTNEIASTSSCLCIWSNEHASTPTVTVVYELAATHEIKVMSYDSTLTQSVAPWVLHSLGAADHMRKCSMAAFQDQGDNYVQCAFTYDGTITPGHTIVKEFAYDTGSSTLSTTTIWWSRLGSKLMKGPGKEVHFWVYSEEDYAGYGTNDQPGAYLVSVNRGSIGNLRVNVVAHALSGTAHELYINETYDIGKLCNLSSETLSSDMYSYRLFWASPYLTDSSTSDKSQAAVNVTFNNFFKNARIDKNHLLTGGYLTTIGNSTVHENGFLQYPVVYSIAGANPGGYMSDGTYSVVAVFEYIDQDGQLHRSAPSEPSSVTLSAGGNVQMITLNVKTMQFGHPSKFVNTKVVVYRTTNGGSIYYNTGCYGYQSASGSYITISVTPSDTTIAANETLYTTGDPSVLDSIAPPSPWDICLSSDRVFILNGEDKAEVWYSKPKEEGIASEFNDFCVIRFPEALECIYYYNAILYGFTKDKIYAVYGEGPDSTNQGNQFSTPQLVSSVTGCANPYSIVECPLGLMFQSQMNMAPLPALTPSATGSESAGLWVLNGNTVQPVIQPDDFSYYPVTSSKNVPKKNQIIFTLWGYTNYNAMLAYDYLTGQWSTHLIYETGAARYPFGEVVNGAHQLVDTSYHYAQTTTFGSADVMRIKTPWVKPSEMLSGYGRIRWVYLLGTYKSSHTLNIRIYYDYDDSTVAETITASVTSSTTPYLFRFKPAKQKCNAIMLEIYDSDLAGTYESFSLDGIMLNVGRKPRQVLSSSRTL